MLLRYQRAVPTDRLHGVQHRGGASLIQAFTLSNTKGKTQMQLYKVDSAEVPSKGGTVRSSVEMTVMVMEQRVGVIQPKFSVNSHVMAG